MWVGGLGRHIWRTAERAFADWPGTVVFPDGGTLCILTKVGGWPLFSAVDGVVLGREERIFVQAVFFGFIIHWRCRIVEAHHRPPWDLHLKDLPDDAFARALREDMEKLVECLERGEEAYRSALDEFNPYRGEEPYIIRIGEEWDGPYRLVEHVVSFPRVVSEFGSDGSEAFGHVVYDPGYATLILGALAEV